PRRDFCRCDSGAGDGRWRTLTPEITGLVPGFRPTRAHGLCGRRTCGQGLPSCSERTTPEEGGSMSRISWLACSVWWLSACAGGQVQPITASPPERSPMQYDEVLASQVAMGVRVEGDAVQLSALWTDVRGERHSHPVGTFRGAIHEQPPLPG